MDEAPRRIEIFAPFEAALELTKRILFQPFDIAKWCVIGFAAFLANLSGGNGVNLPTNWGGKSDWKEFRSATDGLTGGMGAVPEWLIPLVVVGVLLFIVLVLVLTWLGARGQFIFTDCVVKNRGAIVEPWTNYKTEGDSLFFFRLLVGFVFLGLAGLAATPLWLPWALHRTAPEGVGFVVGLVLLMCVVLIGGLCWAIATYFMVPIMYRRRCRAWPALRESAGLAMAEPGPVILFFLFSVVLALAVALIACLLTCVTCCLAAIPYVGTVIMLPLFVFREGYLLLFVRQFGPDYDVWAGLAPAVPVAPPVQESPRPTQPPSSP